MKNKKIKNIINLETIPAILITILNVIVLITDFSAMTWTAILLMIAFWLSGYLIHQKKLGASIIAIIPLIISLIISLKYTNNFIDPYHTHFSFIFFFIIIDLINFYKNKKIKELTKKALSVIILIILATSAITATIDYNRAKKQELPLFMVLVNASDSAEYIGLGYRMTIYNGLTPEDGILSNSTVNFGTWFNLIEIQKGIKNNEETIIEPIEIENNNNQEFTEYFKHQDFTVYSQNAETIIINISNEEYYELKDYLKEHTKTAFNNFIDTHELLKTVDYQQDYTLYKTNTSKILFCKEDIFITDINSELKIDLCIE